MLKRPWLWMLIATFAVGGWWLWATVGVHWAEPSPGRYDAEARSEYLAWDLRHMWETEPMHGTPDPAYGPNQRASTNRAINAASRVFNTVELVGKTSAEVLALLGNPATSSDSRYRSPYAFWPIAQGTIVYCFTNGMYGWQFDVMFNEDGTVAQVQRKWIH